MTAADYKPEEVISDLRAYIASDDERVLSEQEAINLADHMQAMLGKNVNLQADVMGCEHKLKAAQRLRDMACAELRETYAGLATLSDQLGKWMAANAEMEREIAVKDSKIAELEADLAKMDGFEECSMQFCAENKALKAELAAKDARIADFRDTVLHQRGLLAENGMTSEQVNDVLNELDAAISAKGSE